MMLSLLLAIVLYNPYKAQTVTFEELTSLSLPTAVERGAAYIYNDTLNIIGGQPSDITKNKLWSKSLLPLQLQTNGNNELQLRFLNPIHDPDWHQMDIKYPIIYPLNYSSISLSFENQNYAIANDKLYMIAPSINAPNDDMLIFDMESKSFENIYSYSNTLPYQARDACVVSNGTHVFAIGGMWQSGSTFIYHGHTQIYLIELDRWIPGENMIYPKGGHGCSMDRNKEHIYTFGGKYNETYHYYIIEKYTIATGSEFRLCFSDNTYTKRIYTNDKRSMVRGCWSVFEQGYLSANLHIG